MHCVALAALAFAKCGDVQNARRLLSQLTASEAMAAAMRTNPLSLIQTLSALGHAAQSERAWRFYEGFVAKHNGAAHDATALLALAKHKERWSTRRALRTVEAHLGWRRLSVEELLGFHRIALKLKDSDDDAGDQGFAERIWSALSAKPKNKRNVASWIEVDGAALRMDSGFAAGGCRLASHDKVEALLGALAGVGYEVDTQSAPELPTEVARRRHLKSHSEKKALAVLLAAGGDGDGDGDIRVKVDMRMCHDCHLFFAAASKLLPRRRIRCVDPKGTHLFKNGVCYLCG